MEVLEVKKEVLGVKVDWKSKWKFWKPMWKLPPGFHLDFHKFHLEVKMGVLEVLDFQMELWKSSGSFHPFNK